ncbi:AAA-ATPase [Prunus yedoensis var. nudiflora]|uniref:AAA-ATPase n=1 Tax=Prunus yedoensis var. nudiflora TaxID=2094558 RepID=A0A314XUG1_PRUYE|nr:AAA-ATPase [Prunus yedoensis var. nudiflora]
MTTTTTASSMFSAYASFAGSMMLVRSMANQLIPDPIRSYLYSKLNYLFTPLSSNLTMIIDELSGAARNQVYDAAEVYLKTIAISPSTERLRVRKTSRQKSITIAMHKDEQLSDIFHNVKLTWRFKSTEATNGGSGGGRSNKKSAEKRHFELSFHKKHKDKVIDSYLPHVLARADAIKEEQKVVKLYSRSLCSYDDDMTMISSWGSANMEHPSTFETMALDPEMKKMIMEDLERFVRRREFYKKAGKAWKRGYLLYGPPGTGKSSLIAAMANYLKYDVYDLELASIYSNHELRRVLLSTTNRSILVIEDIDCTVDLKNRKLKDKDLSSRT